MDFNKTINWTAKLYKFLEKFKKEEMVPIDSILDASFPEVLAKLQSYSKVAKIAISSTNGKRTTTSLLNCILTANNNSFITNVNKFAKKYPPLTSIILKLSEYYETSQYLKDYFTMALDEDELAGYFNSIKFDYLLLGNLFVDQKDFYTLEEKRKKIQDAIILNSDCNLIINADDPMFYNIEEIENNLITPKKMNKIFYGFNKIDVQDGENYIQKNDILRCPNCACKLDYKKRYYSHIGIFDCECGFKRPELDISADAKVFKDYSFLNVYYKNRKYVFKIPLGGVYNAYNSLGAIAVALTLGIERKVITEALENYKPIRARDEIIQYKNKEIKVKEIKNPASLSEAMREVLGNKNVKVVFALNDEYMDGTDTSWIWDSNFNSFKNFENRIYVCSNRNDDMALRIKYSGVNPSLISMDVSVKNAVKCCFYELEQNERMIIFATPSVVDEIYEILDK